MKSEQQDQTFAFELAHLCQTELFDPLAELIEVHFFTMLVKQQSQFQQLTDGHALVEDMAHHADKLQKHLARRHVGEFVVEDILKLTVENGICQCVSPQKCVFFLLRLVGSDLLIGTFPGEFLFVGEPHEELGPTVGDTLIGIGNHIVEHRNLVKSFPLEGRHGFNLLLGAKGSAA